MPTAKKELSVDDILKIIKNPDQSKKTSSRCILMQKMDELPDNIREAVNVAMSTSGVTNYDIAAFFANHTSLSVSFKSIERHRRKTGCVTCLYGGTK